MDSVLNVISMLIGYFGSVPSVGKYIAIGLSVILSLGAVATAIVGMWHGIVVLLQALASVPGLQGLKGVADSMKIQEDKINDFENNKILPILNRLSAISLPKV